MMTAFQLPWVRAYLGHDPKVIIDAGCYDCTDSIAFKEAWPTAEVYAFEACPDNFGRILSQGKAGSARVNVYHAAVADHEDGFLFHSNTDTNQVANFGQSGSILAPAPRLTAQWPSISYKAPRRVTSVRLDAFCARKGIESIDLLHMDVQGAEYFALMGLGAMRPEMIFLEINETAEVGRYQNAVPEGKIRGWFDQLGYKRVWDSDCDALYVHGS